MDDRKIALLETTFAEVKASQDTSAALFYEQLFVNDPSLRRLFTASDMSAQGRKLMAALALAIGSLRRLDALVHTASGITGSNFEWDVATAAADADADALR